LPVTLHAEHGAFSQRADATWTSAIGPPPTWLEPATVALQAIARRTPGAIVERKDASVAFHHRRCDPTLAGERLREVRHVLSLGLLGSDAEILEGNKVLEVRVRGIDKGALARRLCATGADLIVAAGDDRTDEDMFRVLPDDAISIRVGRGATHARYRLDGPFQLRAALERLAALP
jgi:trehalose 6-phosphate synthase/phosphatase